MGRLGLGVRTPCRGRDGVISGGIFGRGGCLRGQLSPGSYLLESFKCYPLQTSRAIAKAHIQMKLISSLWLAGIVAERRVPLFSLQLHRSTRSSSVVTISRSPTISSLKITDRSFRYASPRLWNQLPDSLRQLNQSCLDSPSHSLVNPSLSSSPLSASITPSLFHSRLKTYLFNKSFQQILPTLTFLLYSFDCLHDSGTGPNLSRSSVYF